MISRSFSRSRLQVLAAVTLLVAGSACGRLFTTNSEADEAERAIVIFTNQSLDQADVFAVVPGNTPLRMGTVMAGRSDTLLVPVQAVNQGNFNIIARLLGRNYMPSTGPVTIRPGDALDVRLGLNDKFLSAVPARQ